MSAAIKAIKQRAELEMLHLPFCRKGYSAIPNIFSGNGLFAATDGKSKSKDIQLSLEKVKLNTPSKKYELYIIGEALSQSNLTTYLRIISLYGIGGTKLGENIWLKFHEFITEEKSSASSQAYAKLEADVKRFYNTEVIIVRPNMPSFYCRLISGYTPIFKGDGNKKMVEINIDRNIRDAFDIDGYTYISLSERFSLGNNQLSLWLHTYYTRHAKPHPITARFIFENSGTRAKDFTRWLRCTLVQAVEKFQPLKGWYLHLDFKNGLDEVKLHCQKPATASQQRYLEKRGIKIE